LCLALGYSHPDELQQNLTAKQLTEWEAFDRVQPIGGKRMDFYFSFLLMSIHNLAIGIHGKKGAKQFTFEDFLPNWTGKLVEEENEVMGTDEIKNFFMSNFKFQSKKKP
jgi:hypothetical protein